MDGGTDILMRGDEAGLGTPVEDMTSLAAALAVEAPVKLVVCLGFGIDAFHGVSHAHFLENVSAVAVNGGYLGATSLLAEQDEGRAFLDLVAFAEGATPDRPSIVNTSIASAIEGRFGNWQRTVRTANSDLFINPLMSLYWAFDLAAVAAQNLYLHRLADTMSMRDVAYEIERFRHEVAVRPARQLPM